MPQVQQPATVQTAAPGAMGAKSLRHPSGHRFWDVRCWFPRHPAYEPEDDDVSRFLTHPASCRTGGALRPKLGLAMVCGAHAVWLRGEGGCGEFVLFLL